MTQRIEKLESARRRMLLSFVAAFALWQVPTIVQDALELAPAEPLNRVLTVVAVLAGLVWLGLSVQLLRVQRAVKRDPDAAEALGDERIGALRARAYGAGFWMLFTYLVAIRVAAFVFPLRADLIAQIGLLIGICGPIAWFLYRDRDDA